MKNRKQIWKNYQVYDKKRSHLEKRLESEFLDHGIVTIPCKVDGIDDILSPYSVEGYESLSGEFVEYINSIVDVVPDYFPIVLSIVGHKFSPDKQKIIRNIIEDDFAYALGAVEKENKHHLLTFLCMAAGLAIVSAMLAIFEWWGQLPMEFLFVFFWFFADVFIGYLLLDGRQLRKQRLKAARLACIKVTFSEKYDERDYSESEAKEFFDTLYRESKDPDS